MDRERIERRDFPTGRRGYDPAAVDEDLRRIADEFEARVHSPAPTLAESTSEQVRLILQAAEQGAAQIRAEARNDVARVQDAAAGMLSKLDALESELSRLLAALRSSGERLVEGLAELQADAAKSLDAPAGDSSTSPADAPSPTPVDAAPPEQDTAPPPPPDAPHVNGTPRPEPSGDSPPLSAPDAPDWPAPADTLFPQDAPDEAGARLIALNMALSGTPREDTKAYLAEHFENLPDVEALLDDVYARADR
jgi:DivIVA domain-containing protein